MAVAPWQPGTTYAPGALCVPRSKGAATVAGLLNPNLADASGWTVAAPLTLGADGAGYGGGGRINVSPPAGQGSAVNQAHIGPLVAGQSVAAACMARHSTGDKHAADVALALQWFTAAGALISTTGGTGLPSLSSSGWQQIKVAGIAPAGVAYCQLAVTLRSGSGDGADASAFTLTYTPPQGAQATMYKATQAQPGKSGTAEPAWPPLGQSVQDNEVTWEGVNLDRIVWQASPLLVSGPTEPEWPLAPGGAVHDGTIDWIANAPTVLDPDAPSGDVATIGASKIFVGDNDIVRFCATNNAADWSTQFDAGYLPTGLQSTTDTVCTGLGLYRGNLAVFMPNTLQVWQIDPDPAQMSFLDQVPGIGTTWQRALCPMQGDLYFLSALGVRSATISAGTANLAAGDIGTPIDALVRADLAAYAAGSPTWEPIGVNLPGSGQFLLFMGDHAWVYTSSPAAQLAAWSRYTLPWTVTDAAVVNDRLYVRADDDCVYVLDDVASADAFADDTASGTAEYTTAVRWPYLDFGNAGNYLDVYGADVLFNERAIGTPGATAIQIGWDENDVAQLTDALAVSAVQARGADGFVPVEVSAPSVSLQVTYNGDGAWELTQANLYVNNASRAP